MTPMRMGCTSCGQRPSRFPRAAHRGAPCGYRPAFRWRGAASRNRLRVLGRAVDDGLPALEREPVEPHRAPPPDVVTDLVGVPRVVGHPEVPVVVLDDRLVAGTGG